MKSWIFMVFLLIPGFAISQNDEKAKVRVVIENLFSGMYQGDSALVRSCFANEAKMFTSSKDTNGLSQLRKGDLTRFITAVGSPHDEVWDEKIYNLKIDLDGGLAHAWMDYTFYLGEAFSHCGVNAMQLVKTGDYWKIISIIDTRRKYDCITE